MAKKATLKKALLEEALLEEAMLEEHRPWCGSTTLFKLVQ